MPTSPLTPTTLAARPISATTLGATHTAAEPIGSAPLLCGHVWLEL